MPSRLAPPVARHRRKGVKEAPDASPPFSVQEICRQLSGGCIADMAKTPLHCACDFVVTWAASTSIPCPAAPLPTTRAKCLGISTKVLLNYVIRHGQQEGNAV